MLVLPFLHFIGWIIEMLIRWPLALKKKDGVSIVVALLFTIFGWAYIPTLIDGIYVALNNKLLLED